MSVLRSLPLTSGVFLVVFILSGVSADNDDLELSPQSDLESMEEIQELLRNVQLIFETKIASKVRQGIVPEDEEDIAVDPSKCTSEGLSATCCHLFQIRRIRFSKNGCLKVTYEPSKTAMQLSLTFGSRSLLSQEVPATNPPPTCAKLSRIPKSPKVCIEFSRLEADKSSLKGCSKAIVRMLGRTLLNIDLGCFEIKVPNANQHDSEVELPYLEGGEAPVRGSKPFW